MVSKQETTRKRIYKFYCDNREQGKFFTVQHFRAEKIPDRTIYSVIKRAESDSGHKRVQGSGHIATKMSVNNIKRLKVMFDHRDGISQSQAARKFNCSQQFISLTLKNKTGISVYKKTVIPKRNERQVEVIRVRSDRLYRKLLDKQCIIDDESYFTLAHSSINGNDNFYSSDRSLTSSAVKYRPVAKFEPKLLMWLAFSEEGVSKPYFIPSGLAVNQKIYLEECIKKRLVPFINLHHADGQYLFWPDLASSHYAKTVLDFFEAQNINFVEKSENPPNVPECRPIENFWGILKGKVYANNWQAKNLAHLKVRIQICLRNIDFDLVKRISGSIRSRVGHVRLHGVVEKNFN